MASEWELVMGMRYGATISPPPVPAAANHVNSSPAYLYGLPSTDTLRIDDLLNLNHDVFSSSHAAAADSHNHSNQALLIPKQENSPTFASESNVSSFADDIYIPTEEAAELEWLSKFVEDSFTDAPYPNYLPAATNNQIRVDPANGAASNRGVRSKRFRSTPAVPRMKFAPTSSSSTSSSSSSDFPTPPPHVSGQSRKKGPPVAEPEGGVRRCTHCASEKTPQWRTGPLGPKTLCNACGVRYKSGRLVPEYRPAASPTFVLTQHSNSHRKVMELRRQKEQITNNAAIYH